VLIVDAYHEMNNYKGMLWHIQRALKPRGRVVVVDNFCPMDQSYSRDRQARKHEISHGFVEEDFRQAGFEVVDRRDSFAREEHLQFLIIVRPLSARE